MHFTSLIAAAAESFKFRHHQKDLCLKFLKFQFCYINSSCARDSSPRPAGPYWLDLQEDSLSAAARQTEDSQNPGRGGGGGQPPAAVSPQESHIKSLHSLNKGEFLEH